MGDLEAQSHTSEVPTVPADLPVLSLKPVIPTTARLWDLSGDQVPWGLGIDAIPSWASCWSIEYSEQHDPSGPLYLSSTLNRRFRILHEHVARGPHPYRAPVP